MSVLDLTILAAAVAFIARDNGQHLEVESVLRVAERNTRSGRRLRGDE